METNKKEIISDREIEVAVEDKAGEDFDISEFENSIETEEDNEDDEITYAELNGEEEIPDNIPPLGKEEMKVTNVTVKEPSENPRERQTARSVPLSQGREERTVLRDLTEPDEEDISRYALRDERMEEFNRLKEYQIKGRIIERRLTGTKTEVEKNHETVYAVLQRGKLEILVRAKYFFDPAILKRDFDSLPEAEKNMRYKAMIRKRLGARISVMLTACTIHRNRETGEVEFTILGDVTLANERKKNYYFFGDEPLVKQGSLVEAKVLSYNERAAIVSCCGVETLMYRRELENRHYISDLTKEKDFSVGKKIVAEVYRLSVDKKTKRVNMRLSCRNIGNDRLKEALRDIKVGDSYLGEVVRVNPNNGTATAYINNKTVRAFIPLEFMVSQQLFVGDTISLTVRRINKDRGFVIGSANCLNIRS